MAADAVAVLDALGVSCAHVVGFSDGAIEALLMARDAPERVASVLALGANLTPEGVLEESGWDLAGNVSILRAWQSWAADPGEGIDPELLSPTPKEAATSAELLQLMLEEPHIDAASLSSISCPATIMVGEFDCIRDDETVAIFNAIPGARLVVVPGCGHSIPKHAPDTLIAELMRLL